MSEPCESEHFLNIFLRWAERWNIFLQRIWNVFSREVLKIAASINPIIIMLLQLRKIFSKGFEPFPTRQMLNVFIWKGFDAYHWERVFNIFFEWFRNVLSWFSEINYPEDFRRLEHALILQTNVMLRCNCHNKYSPKCLDALSQQM